MTKKLKKKLKRISLGSITALLGITAAIVASTSFFGVQEDNVFLAEVSEESYEAENIEIITGTQLQDGETLDLSGVNVAEDGAIICESLVQGAKENNLPDGDYTFRIVGNNGENEETKDYKVELINFYDDVTYALGEGETSKTISLGDSTTEYKTLIVKYHKNLTIN